jgi:hypothetical protein
LMDRAEELTFRLESFSSNWKEEDPDNTSIIHFKILTAYKAMLKSCQRLIHTSSSHRERQFHISRLHRIYNRMIRRYPFEDLTPQVRQATMSAFGEANRNSTLPPTHAIEVFRRISLPNHQQQRNHNYNYNKLVADDYNALIHAWRLSSCSSATSEIETLIQTMKDEGIHDDTVMPNPQTYVQIILAMSTETSYLRAEYWLDELLSLGKKEVLAAEPMLLLGTIIQGCYAAARSNNKISMKSGHRTSCKSPAAVALRVYEAMKSFGIMPDYQTYISLVTCMGCCQMKKGENDNVILYIVQDCINEGKMHPNMIDELQKILLKENFSNFFDHANVSDAWSRNIFKSYRPRTDF